MRSALELCSAAGSQQGANAPAARKASRTGAASTTTPPGGQRTGFASRLAEREADQRALIERANALLSQLDQQPARLQAFELGYVTPFKSCN